MSGYLKFIVIFMAAKRCRFSMKRGFWIGKWANNLVRTHCEELGFTCTRKEAHESFWEKSVTNLEESKPIANPKLYVNNARRFLERVTTPRSCIFLAVVPSIKTDRRVAQILSDSLDLQYIATSVKPYTTYDGNHLKPESAARWANEFLQKADRQLLTCLNPGWAVLLNFMLSFIWHRVSSIHICLVI